MNYQSIPQTLSTQKTTDSLNIKEYKKVNVRILMVNQQELLGTVIIPAKGYRSRLSDLINNSQNFLALTDVEVYQENLLLTKTPFLCVNKQRIIYVVEDESNEIKSNPFLKIKID